MAVVVVVFVPSMLSWPLLGVRAISPSAVRLASCGAVVLVVGEAAVELANPAGVLVTSRAAVLSPSGVVELAGEGDAVGLDLSPARGLGAPLTACLPSSCAVACLPSAGGVVLAEEEDAVGLEVATGVPVKSWFAVLSPSRAVGLARGEDAVGLVVSLAAARGVRCGTCPSPSRAVELAEVEVAVELEVGPGAFAGSPPVGGVVGGLVVLVGEVEVEAEVGVLTWRSSVLAPFRWLDGDFPLSLALSPSRAAVSYSPTGRSPRSPLGW